MSSQKPTRKDSVLNGGIETQERKGREEEQVLSTVFPGGN